jgi:valyl-tRNA synthetase
MDKRYDHQKFEKDIYKKWEQGGYFTPKIKKGKKPFSILLPPPNANDPCHLGHAMYVVEDILCRWHRMMGDPTLFLPGTDHAGIETQFVFEKRLAEKGKSRFDYDRNTLYSMIDSYVEENRGIAKNQLKRLGFSLDWTREKYTLDPSLLKTVNDTFSKLYKDGLIYREERIVNYCTSCGTAFSELEVNHQDKEGAFYYLDYGSLQIATTRPETIFADVAVAVNPNDSRYKKLIGKKAVIPLINKEILIIADEAVDKKLGTGALKITPAHDQTDFEVGQRHKLDSFSVIDSGGKMVSVPKGYLGLSVDEARGKTVSDLEKENKLLKTEKINHSIGTCYRCGTVIEPFLMPQWFVKVDPLAKKAVKAVKDGEVRIIPKRFERIYFNWMKGIYDWNISRQVVWGPRIPAWYCLDCNQSIIVSFIDSKGDKVVGVYSEIKDKYSYKEIQEGLQFLTAPVGAKYFIDQNKVCSECGGRHLLQETDTFDTWFSSGQWPVTTLGYPNSDDFRYFYPTSVLDTMWDILFFWVAKMIMLGIYLTGEAPFRVAHMHSRVVDENGQKMSKSKDNVIEPIKMSDLYGADALRMALVFGVAPASDVSLGEKKIESMRNFTNKIWNAARFITMIAGDIDWKFDLEKKSTHKDDQEIIKKLEKTTQLINKDLEKYRFGQALEKVYQFFWHEFCDVYLEKTKNRRPEALPTLITVLTNSLKLLHPFAPFVTEAIYEIFRNKLNGQSLFSSQMLISSSWPEGKPSNEEKRN